METSRFAVAVELSTEFFDDARVAAAQVRRMRDELAELERSDARIATTKVEVTRRDHRVDVVLGVVAVNDAEAFDIGVATLRASIHAAGGATAGWERLVPSMVVRDDGAVITGRRGSARRGRQSAHRARHQWWNRPSPQFSWEAAEAAAARSARRARPIASMTPEQIVDLRVLA